MKSGISTNKNPVNGNNKNNENRNKHNIKIKNKREVEFQNKQEKNVNVREKLREEKLQSEKDKGITLVALVITVVILIILATVAVNLTIGENGIITKAYEAKYLTELSTYKEELGIFQLSKSMQYENFEPGTMVAGENSLTYSIGETEITEGSIYDVLTSLKDGSFAGKLEIIGGELLLNSTDKTEIEVAQSLDIRVNPYLIVDGVLLSAETNLALMDESGVLTLPESVEKIGNGAFANVSGLKTIIIPGTVKEIGTNAFTNNADLTRVVLEEGIEKIGAEAFKECRNLETIELPESLVSIGNSAFWECSKLNKVKIPSKVTVIAGTTFYGCNSLTDITLPENLERIENIAFLNCSSLNNIYIPKNVTIVGNPFENCTNLVNIEISEGNTKYSYSQDSGMLMDIEKNNIIFISSAVLNNTTTFSIPEGITDFNTSINSYINITTIVIPSSLETISNASMFPTSVSNVQITGGNNVHFAVEDECLYNGDKTELIMCFTKEAEVDIADTVTTVRTNSFRQAINIENILFDENVTTLESQIFGYDNLKLKNIYIGTSVVNVDPIFKYGNYSGTVNVDEMNPKYSSENNEIYNKDKTELIGIYHNIQGSYTVKPSVTKIGDRAFHNKIKMTEVILPEGLKEIGNSFQYCTSLTEIYIPNSVETIASDAFRYSTNLMHIRIDKEPNSIAGAPWGAISWDRAVEWLRPVE